MYRGNQAAKLFKGSCICVSKVHSSGRATVVLIIDRALKWLHRMRSVYSAGKIHRDLGLKPGESQKVALLSTMNDTLDALH